MTEATEAPKDPKAQAKADKAYAKASRPWFKKKRIWILGLIVIFGISQAVSGGGGDSDSNEASTAVESQEPAIEVTAQQLIEALESNALAAKTTYDGKKIILTGELSNIDASGNYFSLTGDDLSFTSVQIFIDDSFVEMVSTFTKGQSVTVTGTVTDVGELLGYSIDAISIP